MTVSIGRSVIIKGLRSNGVDEHPAVVNRVWSANCINVTVLPDNGTPTCLTSIPLYAGRVDAEAALAIGDVQYVAFWPERV